MPISACAQNALCSACGEPSPSAPGAIRCAAAKTAGVPGAQCQGSAEPGEVYPSPDARLSAIRAYERSSEER